MIDHCPDKKPHPAHTFTRHSHYGTPQNPARDIEVNCPGRTRDDYPDDWRDLYNPDPDPGYAHMEPGSGGSHRPTTNAHDAYDGENTDD